MEQLELHPQLDAFRRPLEQHQAIIEIAELPEGRIFVSRTQKQIVGYITLFLMNSLKIR